MLSIEPCSPITILMAHGLSRMGVRDEFCLALPVLLLPTPALHSRRGACVIPATLFSVFLIGNCLSPGSLPWLGLWVDTPQKQAAIS